MTKLRSSRNPLTSSSGELHACRSASPALERGLRTQEEISCWSFCDSRISKDHAGWSGKTCPAFYHLTADGILEAFSGHFANSGILGPGGCWTISISECPQ